MTTEQIKTLIQDRVTALINQRQVIKQEIARLSVDLETAESALRECEHKVQEQQALIFTINTQEKNDEGATQAEAATPPGTVDSTATGPSNRKARTHINGSDVPGATAGS